MTLSLLQKCLISASVGAFSACAAYVVTHDPAPVRLPVPFIKDQARLPQEPLVNAVNAVVTQVEPERLTPPPAQDWKPAAEPKPKAKKRKPKKRRKARAQ